MIHTNLRSLFTDIANAIRSKTGSSAPIVADNFPSAIEDISGGGAKPYSLKKLEPYLYEMVYTDLDHEFAEQWLLEHGDVPVGACSAFSWSGGLARNYDWTYDNLAQFIVRTAPNSNGISTIGFAGGLSDLTESFVQSGEDSNLYKVLPFLLQDGANSKGLTGCMNVVPTDYGEYEDPNFSTKDPLSGLAVIREVLESCGTLAEASSLLSERAVYFPKTLHEMNYELHYIFRDPSGDSLVYEFVNGQMYEYEVPIMTNFYIHGVTFNDDWTVYTPATQDATHDAITTNGVTGHGSGLERFNTLVEGLPSVIDISSAEDLLQEINFTKAYTSSSEAADPPWYTEYVSVGGLEVDDDPSAFIDILAEFATKYTGRSRDTAETWITKHNVVYGIEDGMAKMYFAAEEGTFYDDPFVVVRALSLQDISITENGEYTPSVGKAFGHVSVNVAASSEDAEKIIDGTISQYTGMVSVIKSYAFYARPSLTTVSFPECSTIGNSAFFSCSALTEVSFPECTIIYGNAFFSCWALKEASFPKCSSIDREAFRYCDKLIRASFPVCVTISTSAFRSCSSLTEITIGTESPIVCALANSSVFSGCTALQSIYVPSSLLTRYQSSTNWVYFSAKLVGV